MSGALLKAFRTLAHLRVSPDGALLGYLSMGSQGSRLCVVDSIGGPEIQVATDPGPARCHPHGAGVFDWRGDSRGFVYVGRDGNLYTTTIESPACFLEISKGDIQTVLRSLSESELSKHEIVLDENFQPEMSSPCHHPNSDLIALVVDEGFLVVASHNFGLRVIAPSPTQPSDFIRDPVWSPCGTYLAWIEWDNPNMPWDASRVVVANANRDFDRELILANSNISYDQVRFSPDGRFLSFICDAKGWAQLWTLDITKGFTNAPRLVSELPGEHAEPGWGVGQRSYVWSQDSARIFYLSNSQGSWSLNQVNLLMPESVTEPATTNNQEIQLGTGYLAGLGYLPSIQDLPGRICGITSLNSLVSYEERNLEGSTVGSTRTTGFNLSPGKLLVRANVAGFDESLFEEIHPISWRSEGHEIHGRFIQAPRGGNFRKDGDLPPVLVWIHGGPLGQLFGEFNFRMAYFLDRGWSIFIPDFRGSSGWGRAFARSLKGSWGESDVHDVANGIIEIVSTGLADKSMVIPIGGSSGGTTVLLLLAQYPDLCRAGIALYPVSNFLDLSASTHRFERYYNEFLLGPLPDSKQLYIDRSPIAQAHAISKPVLIFHGESDSVVPVAQSLALVDKMSGNNQQVILKVYNDEGHGWSSPAVTTDELETISEFLSGLEY